MIYSLHIMSNVFIYNSFVSFSFVLIGSHVEAYVPH